MLKGGAVPEGGTRKVSRAPSVRRPAHHRGSVCSRTRVAAPPGEAAHAWTLSSPPPPLPRPRTPGRASRC